MTDYELDLIEKHASKGAVIDTNLFVLFLVGTLDPGKIGTHRRLQSFLREDFTILSAIIRRFKKIYSTPNIMTEISNLIGSGRQ